MVHIFSSFRLSVWIIISWNLSGMKMYFSIQEMLRQFLGKSVLLMIRIYMCLYNLTCCASTLNALYSGQISNINGLWKTPRTIILKQISFTQKPFTIKDRKCGKKQKNLRREGMLYYGYKRKNRQRQHRETKEQAAGNWGWRTCLVPGNMKSQHF